MATKVGTSGNDLPPVLDGTAGIDHIFGLPGNDTLRGFGSHDQLFGGDNTDLLYGGTENDTLNGGLGNDLLDGGAGNDTADYSTAYIDPPGPVGPILNIGATSGVTVGIDNSPEGWTDGVPQNTGGAGIDTLVSIENIIGSRFNDTLWGYEFFGTLDGGGGNDSLFVTDSGATLKGGAGKDRLEITQGGGFGGTSILDGGAGADRLTDSSFDHFEFTTRFDYNKVSDSNQVNGMDTIFGFQGEGADPGDQIDLSTIDANSSVVGNQAFIWIGNNTPLAAGQAGYVGGRLMANVDGGAPDLEIQLVGAPALVVPDDVIL